MDGLRSGFGRSPSQLLAAAGTAARTRRLSLAITQAETAERAGVGLNTVRRFEDGESVGFDAVVRIAIALGCDNHFDDLFPRIDARSIDELVGAEPLRRARGKRR